MGEHMNNITNNLLYLLLLFAVLDKDGRLTTTSGLLIAISLMLLRPCINRCQDEPERRGSFDDCCNRTKFGNDYDRRGYSSHRTDYRSSNFAYDNYM